MRFTDLVQKLGATASSLTVLPDVQPEITGTSPIHQAQPATLSYVESTKYAPAIDHTVASALVLPMDEAIQQRATARGLAWLATPQPRLTFAQAIALFYQPFRQPPGIHPTAVIDPTARLGENVAIGAHVVIQAGVTIGNDVCIHPNVVIYPDVQVGDRTVLHANCVLHERAQIGADCVIHCGAVIGSEGFGFVPTPKGWYKMEQSGKVVLEDGVEVGCNSTIDRPATGDTRIGRSVKIDNLVHIAHGCQVGAGSAMAAQVGIAGGVTLGKGVILAGQVGIANHVTIGDGVIAASKAGIHGNVRTGETVAGFPAVP
ncbi:MAG: UDP-3-O-(3-hydroxymyristoyl)glucosamine N-acyltransferase, partial [Cyanobacteriota bacterium SKYGB_h_bin112]|nr:UDP-3-O-(3-hydroxymyristoyl)glucosamine N-acyltransferase [Cyanobacteriota bacterium SKYGB_h_bin112]